MVFAVREGSPAVMRRAGAVGPSETRHARTFRARRPGYLGPMSTPPVPLRDTTFCPGGEFTVGVEDELLLVDADGQLASGEAATMVAALGRDRLGNASVSREVYDSQVEFNTPVCPDAEAVADCLHRCRSALRAAGHRAVGTGLHPTAELG